MLISLAIRTHYNHVLEPVEQSFNNPRYKRFHDMVRVLQPAFWIALLQILIHDMRQQNGYRRHRLIIECNLPLAFPVVVSMPQDETVG